MLIVQGRNRKYDEEKKKPEMKKKNIFIIICNFISVHLTIAFTFETVFTMSPLYRRLKLLSL